MYPNNNYYNSPQPYPAPMSYYAPPMPYYAPPPPPQRQEPAPIYNKNLKYSFSSDGDKKAIVLQNVELPHACGLMCKTMPFRRQSPDKRGNMRFEFTPDGDEHTVSVVNYGHPVYTFNLKPQPPSVKFFENGNSKMQITNLYNKDSLQLSSDNEIKWHLEHQKGNNYLLHFDAMGKVHNIQLSTVDKNGKKTLLNNGKFKLAPLHKPEPVQRQPPPPMYAPQPYAYPSYPPPQNAYGYPPNAPQQMAYGYQGYGQPMPAAQSWGKPMIRDSRAM